MATPLPKYFRPGQYLFREGDTPRALYLIKKGTVAIRKRKGVAYVEIARIYSNEVLGELSFFDRQPRSAAAIALTEVEVLEIEFDSLDKIYTGVPEYMKTIISSVTERLRKANEVIRRLQKQLVTDGGKDAKNLDEAGETTIGSGDPSAADVLAASVAIGLPGSKPADVPTESKTEEKKSSESDSSD